MIAQMPGGNSAPDRPLVISSGICFLVYIGLAWLSHQDGLLGFSLFFPAATLCTLLGVLVVWHYSNQQREIPFAWILGTAIVFRATGVIGQPFLEDDFYRYLWDGFRTAETGDPFSLPPAWYFSVNDLPPGFEEILSRINYPHIATVYGPVCQWIFALSYMIAPGEIWPLQLLAAMADIVILVVLRSLCQHNALLLYAWSPLLVKEFSFTAHPDVFAVLMVMLALRFRYVSHGVFAGVLLALAVGSKIFALILVPFLLISWRNLKRTAIAVTAFLLTLLMTTLWFGTFTIWMPEGLQVMADSWLFNAPLYILPIPIASFQWIKLFLLSLFLVFAAGLLYRWYVQTSSETGGMTGAKAPLPRGDLLYGAFLLCIPVLNPWYLIWVLPFAVLKPSRWAWTASVALLLSYSAIVSGGEPSGAPYQVSTSVLILEFGAIGLAVLLDWKRPLNVRRRNKSASAA